MVLKLAGKCILFALLWLNSIRAFENSKDQGPIPFLGFIPGDKTIIISQGLAIVYFLIITLGFLEVKSAVFLLILNCLRKIHQYESQLFLIKDLILLSGLISYYNKISKLEPLVLLKKP
jgi:hypothetical protein